MKKTAQEIQTLALRIQQGEEIPEETRYQIEKLIHHLKPLILALHRKHKTVFDSSEDALQEGALTLLECLKNYDSTQRVPFIAYAQQQLRYHFYKGYRRKRLLLTLDAPAAQLMEDISETRGNQLPDTSETAEEMLLREEELKALSSSMHHLNNKEINLIYQHYIRQLPLKEVAADLNLHPVTLSRQKAAVLGKLKKHINPTP
ncbi:sigma-70 family RNA polymerase sigma factor [Tindallia californiensis]|uniref:RNA polymerase sigma factor, sigma-70 family n=1 Tax=Tindallia californiensis TaxID=159292 RepID=A0A1H3PDB0_9FIRM|nr:sigma-70 family RNA polymerase sigma factor [Tindallia californiensis]SDY99070.1 RNA polymerase sigma factor, sigma-70 family [Tindallia californiensis]